MFTTTIQSLSRHQCSKPPSRVEAGINVHNYHPESKQASMFTTTIQSPSRHQCSTLPSRVQAGINVQHYQPESKHATMTLVTIFPTSPHRHYYSAVNCRHNALIRWPSFFSFSCLSSHWTDNFLKLYENVVLEQLNEEVLEKFQCKIHYPKSEHDCLTVRMHRFWLRRNLSLH